MNGESEPERISTVVVGGGQAGLSVGYHLARRGLPFAVLDANERIGDAWRNRWDSLRVFTPARYNGLPGMPFPAPARSFPTKDEVADYLETYAARFDLPVQTGVRVDRLSKANGRFVLTAGDRRLQAENVVVAMSSHRSPRVPAFAAELDPGVIQMHSDEYRIRPSCATGTPLSLEHTTRVARSPSIPPRDTQRGCREGIPAMSRSASTVSWVGSSAYLW